MNEQYKKVEGEYYLYQQPYKATTNDLDIIPFSGQSELEITVNESSVKSNNPKIDKSGAICAFFLCDLPFDC